MKKKILVATGGGDCPGLNAVIRAIVKRADLEPDYEVYGSIEAYNGVLMDPQEIIRLDDQAVAGIHIRGGTIIGTTNKGGPFNWPVEQPDGSWVGIDRSDEMIQMLKDQGFHAVISIGGDGSQRISKQLFDKGLNVVGVPKTIDNDLSATDMTFGFQTAVQVATEGVDKLVTTAESHNRVIIMEVMGRDAGWIALHAAVAGGSEVCLIPEIPYDINKVVERIEKRYEERRGFAIVVVAEGAKPKGGTVVGQASKEVGYENVRLGGIGYRLKEELTQAGLKASMRVTVLGHLQRGGIPIAFDRVLAAGFGVHAFEMVKQGKFGQMVAYKHNDIIDVPLEEAVKDYNYCTEDAFVMRTARGMGISLGD
ncbi:ATP-dependent 6-phosphofructokinase [Pontibacter sp. G13]|uniref:6-phosphofructokinase n=1 Tax=Pontibacter sp. G13 TaxID=3074898 RepID=UPI00288BF07C|nr:ATP-dependent 6-phosphofructokinase [Pontibacter sp. G13]WNJ17314.1 ATP-dependent 6-phosphofructokinase [Pontibacter sp. G13]